MAWFETLDAKCKALDRRWEAWLDRHLSPSMDWFITMYPLIALVIIGVLFLL